MSVHQSVCLSVCGDVCLSVDVGAYNVARCRSMKRAYQSAVENAFSRLLVVVLDNGKVFVEVNSVMTDASTPQSSVSPTRDQCLTVCLAF